MNEIAGRVFGGKFRPSIQGKTSEASNLQFPEDYDSLIITRFHRLNHKVCDNIMDITILASAEKSL